MSKFNTYVMESPPGRRIWLAVLAGCLIFALVGGLYLALRPDYQVLFSNLRTQDASAIVDQLEHDKIPFRIAQNGTAILVPEPQMHRLRLKLMNSDIPFKGTVGFELFNGSDLGLTEFSQKVNYQRALQGELARTIMSLQEIDTARVHLVLAETSMFRRSSAQSKASVAISTKPGFELDPLSVKGIQRLVAAAVPELTPAEVIVVDERGAPLNGAAAPGMMVDDPNVQAKLALEQMYVQKITAAIEPMIGHGNATVNVDATVDFDQVRITEESSTGTGAQAPAVKRVQNTVPAQGRIKRLTIGVVLHEHLSHEDQMQLEALIDAVAGLVPSRGDALTVLTRSLPAAVEPPAHAVAAPQTVTSLQPLAAPAKALPFWQQRYLPALLIGLAILFAFAIYVAASRPRKARLTAEQRDDYVMRLRAMLQEERHDAAA